MDPVKIKTDTDRVHYSTDPYPDFVPDPAYNPNDLLTRWRESGLPLPRSVHWTTHEQALADLHHRPPHWSREQVEQTIDKLLADYRGPRALSWAWKAGPTYLARQRPGEPQGIEKVLGWETLERARGDPGGRQKDFRAELRAGREKVLAREKARLESEKSKKSEVQI